MNTRLQMTGRTGWFLGLGLLLVTLLAAFPVLIQAGWLSTHLGSSIWCVAIWLIGYSVVVLSDARGLWSPMAVFFVIFAFFHYGLAVMVVLGGTTDDIGWFLNPEVPQALALVGLGGIGLALGGVAPAVFREIALLRETSPVMHDEDPLSQQSGPSERLFGHMMSQVGSVIAMACILGWIFMTLFATGGRLFGLSYGEFLLATEGYPRPWITFGIALGVALSAIDFEHRASRITMWFFILWALIALPIGIRGDVMFPVAGALTAQAWRLRHIPARYFIGGAVIVLSLASLLREVRMEGVSRVDWRWEVISPANALKELGQSLRPTYETIRWIQDGDEHLYGASIWSPFERGFLRLFPLQDRPALDEERQLTVLVFNRVGPIGFSPVAEAYYNFGTLGVPIFMGCMGFIVGVLGLMGSSLLGRGLMLMTLIPLLIFVRNSFTQMPGQMAVGWALVFSLWALASLIAKRMDGVGTALSDKRIERTGEQSDFPDQNRPI